MRRRTLLAAFSAGLAGCSLGQETETPTLTPVDYADGSPTPTGTKTPDGDQRSPGELGAASVITLETGPRTLALSPPAYRGPDGAHVRVEFVETATADGPARLRAELTNGNDWSNTFRLRDIPPFVETAHARIRDPDRDLDARSTLYLAPTADHDLVDEDPEYRRESEGYWRLEGHPSELPRTVRLDPGESVGGEYLLLGNRERLGFPAGDYSFERDGHGFSIAAWDSDAPGPEATSRFEGADPPALPHSDAMAWYHDAGGTTETYLRPSTERTDDPGRVDLTLVNHSTESMSGNPYDWGLYKLVDGEWHRIEPWAVPSPLSAVPPGRTEEYVLRAFHGDSVRCDDGYDVGRLGGGTYAFDVGFSREGESRTHAALFDFAAPDVSVRPPEGPTVERDGRTVTVTTDEWDDGEYPQNATLTVDPLSDDQRRDGTADLERIISEQLYRRPYRALRHVLPRFESDADRVVLRADKHVVEDAAGYDSRSKRFRYRNRGYEATTWVAERGDGRDDSATVVEEQSGSGESTPTRPDYSSASFSGLDGW